MSGWHQTIVIGYVGKDATLQYTQSGVAIANFSVAVTDVWKDKSTGEKRERTTWYNVSAWKALADISSKYIRKGMQIMVTGNVTAQGYTNNAGEVRASLNLNAREIKFLGKKDESSSSGNAGEEGDEYSGFTPPPTNSDDIPF